MRCLSPPTPSSSYVEEFLMTDRRLPMRRSPVASAKIDEKKVISAIDSVDVVNVGSMYAGVQN